jgi:uncharacterized protein (DUF2147 family)
MHLAKKLAAALLCAICAAAPAFAADPTGTWQSTSGESRYKVTYCGDGTQLCAKLTWLREDAKTRENLAYLNRFVVKGAVPAGENTWQGAVAYAGDTYEGSVTLVSETALKLKGCKGMFCQSMNFVRH